MPIGSDEFEAGKKKDSYAERVHHFLQSHSDKAYTPREIFVELNNGQEPSAGELVPLGTALNSLTAERKVDMRLVSDPRGVVEYYYRAKG